jgi:hypothetical protein
LPFTLSHAAAVLPAVRGDGRGRGRLVPAVLVAGSFAPDMTYYAASAVPGAMEFGNVTHSFPGVFTVDVVITWTTVALWLLLREPLVALLPRARQPRTATLLRCGTPRARATPSLAALVVRLRGARRPDPRRVGRVHAPRPVGRTAVPRPRPTVGRQAAVLGPAVRQFGARRPADHRVRGACATTGSGRRAGGGARAVGTGPVGGRGRPRRLRPGRGGGTGVAWWAYWGSTASPWDLIPTLCFGAGAGTGAGRAAVRRRRPRVASRHPGCRATRTRSARGGAVVPGSR